MDQDIFQVVPLYIIEVDSTLRAVLPRVAYNSTALVAHPQMDNTADLWSILMAVALEMAREGRLQEWVCIGAMTILSKFTIMF